MLKMGVKILKTSVVNYSSFVPYVQYKEIPISTNVETNGKKTLDNNYNLICVFLLWYSSFRVTFYSPNEWTSKISR